jgi:hypothetical protein
LVLRIHTDASRREAAPTPRDATATVVAETELRPNELQDLTDVVGELALVAAGHRLKFRLWIQLGETHDGGQAPPPEVVDQANKILHRVSGALQLE